MCRKLRELNGLSAAQLLKKTGQSSVFPVDVAQICYDLDIRLKPFDFSQIERSLELDHRIEKKDRILGAVLVNKDDLAILYRSEDSVNRKRFTIAHEIAHCCLHMDPDEKRHLEFRTDALTDEKKEMEANIFAGELLIPEEGVRKMLGENKYIGHSSLQMIAALFMVSENVMKARLNRLKISIY